MGDSKLGRAEQGSVAAGAQPLDLMTIAAIVDMVIARRMACQTAEVCAAPSPGPDIKARVLTEKELAEELGLSPWTIRTLRLQKGLPHFRTAGRIFYRLETVIRWLENQEQSCSKPTIEPTQYGKLRRID